MKCEEEGAMVDRRVTMAKRNNKAIDIVIRVSSVKLYRLDKSNTDSNITVNETTSLLPQ